MECGNKYILNEILNNTWLESSYGGINQLQYEVEQCLVQLNKIINEFNSNAFNNNSIFVFSQALSKFESIKATA